MKAEISKGYSIVGHRVYPMAAEQNAVDLEWYHTSAWKA